MSAELACAAVLGWTLALAALFPARGVAVVLAALTMLAVAAGAGGWEFPHWSLPMWRPVAMVLALSLLAGAAQQTGLVSWLAVRAVRASRGDPWRLLLLLCALIALISALLHNVLALVIVGSLTVVASRRLGLDLMPFLVVETVCAGLCGLLTLTSSMPTAIFAALGTFSYVDVMLGGGPFVLFGIALTLGGARVVYYRVFAPLSETACKIAQRRVERFEETSVLSDGPLLQPIWIILPATLLLLALQGVAPGMARLEPALILLGGAAIALLFSPREAQESPARVDWNVILYLLAMGVIYGACEACGLFATLRRLLLGALSSTTAALLWTLIGSSLAGGLLGNIQSSLLLAALLEGAQVHASEGVWWAALLGSGLANILPPVGGGVLVAALAVLREQEAPGRYLRFLGELALFWLLLLAPAAAWALAIGVMGRVALYGCGALAWLGILGGMVWLVLQLRRV